MTENEAIYCLKADSELYSEVCEECNLHGLVGCDHCQNDAIEVAIKALEEVQQYRKNGITVENAVDNMCNLICAKSLIAEYRAIGTPEELQDMKNNYFEALSDWRQYRKIGTLEECRVAVEKQTAKKPTPIDYEKYANLVDNAKFLRGAYWCPNCNHVVKSGTFCNNCGQKLDWSDEE